MAKVALRFSPFTVSADADLLAAKTEMSQRFLAGRAARPHGAVLFSAAVNPEPAVNVLGVGIGEKISEGRPTGLQAVKFFVRSKIPAAYLSPANLLPESVGGLPTDVEETGLLLPIAKKRVATAAAPRAKKKVAAAPALPNPRQRYRPAPPGSSIGFRHPSHPQLKMAGTFGAVVTDDAGALYILSNNHVLADENRLPLGDPIFQPGLLDGGRLNKDRIAELTRFVPLDPNGDNVVDAAIARALDPSDLTRNILFIGPPAGVSAAQFDMIVHKFGRTTSYTAGRVTSLNTDVVVAYDIGSVFFAEQIIIRSLTEQPFSRPGDSGSLILERRSNNAIGLLFAGSDSHTVANHIQAVLDALAVRLA